MTRYDADEIFLTAEEYNNLESEAQAMIRSALDLNNKIKKSYSQTEHWRSKYFKEVKK